MDHISCSFILQIVILVNAVETGKYSLHSKNNAIFTSWGVKFKFYQTYTKKY